MTNDLFYSDLKHFLSVLRIPGSAQLLTTIYNHMAAFKQVMDSTTQAQMGYLIQEYDGFYRFAKLLEQIAQGVSDGTIQVPKDP